MRYYKTSILSLFDIHPSVTISALNPPDNLNAEMTCQRLIVSFSSSLPNKVQGSHNSIPINSTSPTLNRLPTKSFKQTP